MRGVDAKRLNVTVTASTSVDTTESEAVVKMIGDYVKSKGYESAVDLDVAFTSRPERFVVVGMTTIENPTAANAKDVQLAIDKEIAALKQ